ncbi:MAG TPA: hypothetical protein VI409_13020 [Gaiellaceae bacterium]|nr:hypothetical protein [Gaiellaceae bacterium]
MMSRWRTGSLRVETKRLHWAIAATLLLFVASGLAVQPTTAASRAHAVTLNVGQYRNSNGVRVLVFSGSVTSNAGGEDVEVLGQDCGVRGSRLISATQTRAGGGWQVENPEQNPPWRYTPVYSGITFRARWNNQLSAPYVDRVAAPIVASKIRGRRAWRVYVAPPPPGTVSMKGKLVELQRLRRGLWKTIQRARLVYKPRLQYGGALNHEAVFAVPARGWTLRASLPAQSAAPCYSAGVTPQWRS